MTTADAKITLSRFIGELIKARLADGPTDAAEQIVRHLAGEYLIDLEEIDEDGPALDED